MRRKVLAPLVATGALLAGCSGEAIDDNPRPEVEQTTTSTTPNDEVQYTLAYAESADKQFAALQLEIGKKAISLIEGVQFSVTIAGREHKASMHEPRNQEAREHAIIFTQDSSDSQTLLEELDIAVPEGSTNVTIYNLDARDNQHGYSLSGPSVSVVGQEMDNVGPFHAIATEACQGMDMAFENPDITVNEYRLAKEAICNTLGIAADSKYLDMDHSQYLDRIANSQLSKFIAQDQVIKYPAIPADIYDQL